MGVSPARSEHASTSGPRSAGGPALLIALSALSAFGPLCLDMYLPALPQLPAGLNSTAGAAQLSLTACLVGLALGQLVAGPLSDRVGRRVPLLVGVAVFVVASALCALTPSMAMLIGLRFVQGAAGAAGIVISRAVVADMMAGSAAAAYFSAMAAINGLAPDPGAGDRGADPAVRRLAHGVLGAHRDRRRAVVAHPVRGGRDAAGESARGSGCRCSAAFVRSGAGRPVVSGLCAGRHRGVGGHVRVHQRVPVPAPGRIRSDGPAVLALFRRQRPGHHRLHRAGPGSVATLSSGPVVGGQPGSGRDRRRRAARRGARPGGGSGPCWPGCS